MIFKALLFFLFASCAWGCVVPLTEAATPGKNLFQEQLKIFLDPKPYFQAPYEDTTDAEDEAISRLALEILLKRGGKTSNAHHIADILASVEALTPQLLGKGISPAKMRMLVLVHDLGKEYPELPQNYRDFMEEIFPPPPAAGLFDPFYLERNIMPHEFASMVQIEMMGKKLNLPLEKIDRVKALIARHNAGYDPNLPGFHFWVQPYAWEKFARAMNERNISVPLVYHPVVKEREGGRVETILLTALDRAASLTLAAQEKFSSILVTRKAWNNEALARQCADTQQNVLLEIRNVLGKLNQPEEWIAAVELVHQDDLRRLDLLAHQLADLDQAPKVPYQKSQTSIQYRDNQGRWFSVTSRGKIFLFYDGQWMKIEEALSDNHMHEVPYLLFRKLVFLDFRYTPRPLLNSLR